jgi:hypothetical protein
MGTVPDWLAAGSLLLAFTAFRRDRANAARAQLGLVGVWADRVAYTVPAPSVQVNVRNGSALPVRVDEVAFEIRTEWRGPDVAADRSSGIDRATFHPRISQPFVVVGIGPVAPDGIWSRVCNFELASLPRSGMHLDHACCVVNWACLTDNAGRKWRVRPHQGGKAERLHWWYSREKTQTRITLGDGKVPTDVAYVSDSDTMHAEDGGERAG